MPGEHDIGTIIKALDHEEAEALAEDLLRTSDTICRRNVRAM